VEASFFLDFLDTFSSRKKFQYLIAPMESFGPKAKNQIFLRLVTKPTSGNAETCPSAGEVPL
jgi:hypothetical protein